MTASPVNGRFQWPACIATDAPCQAVYVPVDCFYHHGPTASSLPFQGSVHRPAGYWCFLRLSVRRPRNIPRVGQFPVRAARWTNAHYSVAGGPEADNSKEEYEKYGTKSGLAEGKLPLCAEMCSTKSSACRRTGEIIAQILQGTRDQARGYGAGGLGDGRTAYRRETITSWI